MLVRWYDGGRAEVQEEVREWSGRGMGGRAGLGEVCRRQRRGRVYGVSYDSVDC